MTPEIGLHLTVWLCTAAVLVGGLLVAWSVAPHKVWMRNLRLSLLMPVTGAGLLACWWAFLRFPEAVVAAVLALQGASIPDLRYWIMLLPAMVFCAALTIACFYEATLEALDLWVDPKRNQLN